MSTHSITNRILIPAFIFIALALCIFLFLFFGGHRQIHSSDNANYNVADSASITRWDIIPKGDPAATYTVFKDTGVWKIRMQDHSIVDADLKIVGRCLKHLSKFQSAEHAKLDKSKWKEEGLD